MERLTVDIEQAGYPDRKDVIRDIRFDIKAGELVGLIGPNGAGKSTTIKAILGLLPDVSGTVRFHGDGADEQGTCAYIPEHPILYDELTLWEHMELCAAAFDMDAGTFEERANELLCRFRLDGVKHHLPVSFSKGMQQKMMLILGFLQKPSMYIVDEPFIGLDPRATKDLLSMLDDERSRGCGVLMSTHVLDTAERICDRFLLISDGALMAEGDLQDIRERCKMPDATLFDCFHSLV